MDDLLGCDLGFAKKKLKGRKKDVKTEMVKPEQEKKKTKNARSAEKKTVKPKKEKNPKIKVVRSPEKTTCRKSASD